MTATTTTATFTDEIAEHEHTSWCRPAACYVIRLRRGDGYKPGTRRVRHVRRVSYDEVLAEVFVTTVQAPGGPVVIEEFGVTGLSVGLELMTEIPFDGGWAAIVYEAMKAAEDNNRQLAGVR